jgi:SAM-dependent methyltransferase
MQKIAGSNWISCLACPKCGGSLVSSSSVVLPVADDSLRCSSCSTCYPIHECVPILLAEATDAEKKTQKLYGNIWHGYVEKKPNRSRRGYDAPATSNLELLRLASGTELVQGQAGIDAGCGSGDSTIAMARQHPDIRFIGVDLAPGVFHAASKALDIPNLFFVQGNLMAPPLAKQAFDFVYSFGVLHHTRSPETAFRLLLDCLRPGGRITIFVYKDFSDLPVKKLLLIPVTLVRRLTSRLPSGILRILAWIGAPLIFFFLTLPARLLRILGFQHFSRHIPYSIFPHITAIASSLEDRFGVPYEHRFSLRNLQAWAITAGLKNARAVDCLPWGFSGLVLTGCLPSKIVRSSAEE